MAIIHTGTNDTVVSWLQNTNDMGAAIGDMDLLSQSDLVSAILGIDSDVNNTLNTTLANIDSDIAEIYIAIDNINVDSDITAIVGVLDDLDTTEKTTLVAALNEVNRRLIDVYDNSGTLLNI